ncbi:exoenzyme regulatory protein aepA precursor [Synergistales bacterium]|nr:exoenzyme regulatory protein aepA precursor [Synergistales bacterium]
MKLKKKEALLVHGGQVWTGVELGDGSRPTADAFLVKDGRFAAVGSLEEVESAALGCDVDRINVEKSLVVPGMSDAHMHLTPYCKRELDLDLSAASSIDELLSLLKAYVDNHPDVHWLRAMGYNENLWRKPVVPTMEMVDSVAGDHAVVLSHYGGHMHVAGRRALEESGLWGPEIEKAAGLLYDSEAAPVLQKITEAHETREIIKKLAIEGFKRLASLGLTMVHACDVVLYGLSEYVSIFQELRDEGLLPVRVMTYHDALPNLDFRSGMGDRLVGYAGLKLFLDGTLGGWTAAMREDFSDKPGSRGQLIYTDDDLFSLLLEASKRGIQVQMHMIGDAATDQAVRVARRLYERIGSKPRLPLRFNHVIVSPPDQIEALAALGVVVDIQPIQVHTDRLMAPLRLGPKRLGHAYPFRSLYRACIVTGSSDGPIEDVNPWVGIWAAVSRTEFDGTPLKSFDPREALTLDEALTIYTKNPYRALGWQDCGVIALGATADFVILESNPFNQDPRELLNVKVKSTYLDGVKTWG